VDYWMPFALRRDPAPAGYFVFVVGRLESGVSVPAAQAEMSALADQIARERGVEPLSGVVVTGLRGDLSRDLRTSLLRLFAAVGALILLACFNVAGLLLARGVHRRQEMAIRFSLGAGRAAIVRQLLTEGLVLAGAGAGLGIVVSTWTVSGLVAVAPINVLETMDVGLDGRVLLYVLGLSLATAIAFTLVPALTAVRRSPRIHPAANRTHTRTNRLRQGLVVAQVALALILASGAGLLGRTLQGLLGGHIGVDARDVLSLPVALPAARYDARARVRFFREAVERLERLQGVQSAGAGRTQPVTGVAFTVPFHVDGTPELLPVDQAATTDTGRIATSLTRVAAPGYFRTLGVTLLGGRDFAPDDLRENAPPVFVVNQAFVRAYFPAADPLGKVITTPVIGADPPEMVEGRIVGVVGDVKEGSLRREAQPTFYSDHGHAPSESMALFVRAEPAQGLPQAAVRVIREMDPDVPVTPIWLEDLYASTVTRERMNAIVLGAFAATALLLAAFGLYGLLVYLVADRTREIGIRMALGAPSQGVLLDVIGQGMRLVIAGVVLGLAGALAFSRSLEGLLYGVAPYDPATFAPVVGLLLSVAAVAIWGPARRATRVDPLTALQDE
jgi:predicted permease